MSLAIAALIGTNHVQFGKTFVRRDQESDRLVLLKVWVYHSLTLCSIPLICKAGRHEHSPTGSVILNSTDNPKLPSKTAVNY